ncbi:MAG TPA: sigma-70 family RNA polymerase sigma factor [Polyangia bacterium]|nr:sigma-70 family RNA polymerase sigma factor [Polyangia bacterium]
MASYLRDVRCHAVMSRDEEHDIAVRFAATGDQRLADRLVNANLRLVLKIAFEYRLSRRDVTDLIQEGNLGLVHAVQKFDPHRGVKLATYATWWIRAYMLKFMLANARLVKVGTTRAQRKLFFSLRRARMHLEGKSASDVGADQLAASLAVSEGEVVDMERRLAAPDASLDAPAHLGDDRNLMECIDAGGELAESQLVRSELQEKVCRELEAFGRRLRGRDDLIFRQRLFCDEPTTLASLAADFNVSRERVRQIELRLKERLRVHLVRKLGDAVAEAA